MHQEAEKLISTSHAAACCRGAARAFGVPGLAALDHLLGLRMQQVSKLIG